MQASRSAAPATQLATNIRLQRARRLSAPSATARSSAARLAALLRPAVHSPLRLLVASSSHTHHSSTASAATSPDLAADINAACNEALQTMLANNRQRVPEVERRLQSLRMRALEEAQDLEVGGQKL